MKHLTVTEVALELQLSAATVKRYIYDGRIASVKLPGGQHRIPHSEIERLLQAECEIPEVPSASVDLEARVAVLERWMSEQEAELERLAASQQVLSTYATRAHEHDEPHEAHAGPPPPRVLVLGPGCKRCEALHELSARVLRGLGLDVGLLGHVKDLTEIAEYGPVLTPALVVDGEVVLSGRVPTEGRLRKVLAQRLA